MAVSNKTALAIYKVLRKHLTTSILLNILTELSQVEGNKSFKTTIEMLKKEIDDNKDDTEKNDVVD